MRDAMTRNGRNMRRDGVEGAVTTLLPSGGCADDCESRALEPGWKRRPRAQCDMPVCIWPRAPGVAEERAKRVGEGSALRGRDA